MSTDTELTSTSSAAKNKKKVKASSQNKKTNSTYMKNKEGIQAEDYEPLVNLIKCLSNSTITTEEAFVKEATKFKLKKSLVNMTIAIV